MVSMTENESKVLPKVNERALVICVETENQTLNPDQQTACAKAVSKTMLGMPPSVFESQKP